MATVNILEEHTRISNSHSVKPTDHAKLTLDFTIKTLELTRQTAGGDARMVINRQLVTLYAQRKALV